jgi:type II secretory pathway predicted ATPase ExeA
MTDQEKIPIVETEVYTRMEWAIRNVLDTAGLGVVKGEPGIGKTEAIKDMIARLRSEGARAELVTVTEGNAKNCKALCNSLLAQYSGHVESYLDEAMEAFTSTVLGRPFGCGPKSVLIVDECQMAKPTILTMLRQEWDRGDGARRLRHHGTDAAAFGLVLCGNNFFLNRRGQRQEMDVGPLKDRVMMTLNLRNPDLSDMRRVAAAYLPLDAAATAELAQFGAQEGTIRAMMNVLGQAELLADGGDITVAEIRDAIQIVRGI